MVDEAMRGMGGSAGQAMRAGKARTTGPSECLPILRTVIDLSERPTAVVGHSPSGESRI